MSLHVKGGIRKLSELEIDADKDWQIKGISNLKEIVPGMAKGDLVVKGDSVLQKIAPGTTSNVLTSAGPGKIPVWMPGAAMEVWIPAEIIISHGEGKVTVDRQIAKTPSTFTSHIENYLDDPSNLIKRLNPSMIISHTESTVIPDDSISKTPAVGTEGEVRLVVAGAVADDGGVQTDETSGAQDSTPDDMTLLPALPAINDAYYLMSPYKAPRFYVNVTIAGVGNWAFAYEYWNGTGWSAMVDIYDGTSEWTIAGTSLISHTPQGDWAQTTIMTGTGYWIRARVTAFNNITTQPLGGRAWYALLA